MRRIAAEKAGFESHGNFRQAARRPGDSGFTHLGRSVTRNVAICNAVLPAPLPSSASAGPAAVVARTRLEQIIYVSTVEDGGTDDALPQPA
jgi:hypothetical protein